jgi:hypothetical protein
MLCVWGASTVITVFYVPTNNLNRTYTTLIKEFMRLAGPDFQVVNANAVECDVVQEMVKRSDLVVCDHSISYARDYEPETITTAPIGGWKGKAFFEDIWGSIVTAGCIRFYIASGWDLHWPGLNLDEIQRFHAIAWAFEKCPISRRDVKPEYQDPWMAKHSDPLDNWHRVVNTVKSRLEFIHCLGEDEYTSRPRRKLWDFIVPGDTYATRLMVLTNAVEDGVSLAPYHQWDGFLTKEIMRKWIPLSVLNRSKLRNVIRQRDQKFLIERSKVTYVCGSGYRYTVRKFFEVPAAYATLLAFPSANFAQYGFIDGENFIATTPEDAARDCRKLLGNPSLMDRLRRRAYELVRREHSARKRAQDFLSCFHHLAQGKTVNAQFHAGKFVISSR